MVAPLGVTVISFVIMICNACNTEIGVKGDS